MYVFENYYYVCENLFMAVLGIEIYQLEKLQPCKVSRSYNGISYDNYVQRLVQSVFNGVQNQWCTFILQKKN